MPRSTSAALPAVARSRDLKLTGLALVVMLGCAGIQLVALDVPWLRRLELLTLDEQMRIRGVQAPGPAVVLVMIDDQNWYMISPIRPT